MKTTKSSLLFSIAARALTTTTTTSLLPYHYCSAFFLQPTIILRQQQHTTHYHVGSSILLNQQKHQRCQRSSFTLLHQAPTTSSSSESIAENKKKKEETTETILTTSDGTSSSIQQHDDTTTAMGEILSYNTLGFAVVKLRQEDIVSSSQLPKTLSASGLVGDSVPLVTGNGEEEEEKVELANALFGNGQQPQSKSNVDMMKKDKKGSLVDGDLTGRTVTFSINNNSFKQVGIVIAHRHPIAFVLLLDNDDDDSNNDDNSNSNDSSDIINNVVGKECTISTNMISIDPSGIPIGSIVNYMGKPLSVLEDGSVYRTLPKASTSVSSTAGAVISNGVDINLSIDMSSMKNTDTSRPIFVPIPKISDIGLIDSPLVTGITAIDALTPIGKGQNMLIIGKNDDDDDDVGNDEGGNDGGVNNKRKWMINLLKNVIQNQKEQQEQEVNPSSDTNGGSNIRCYYGLTIGNNNVRKNVMNDMKEFGILDDVTMIVSNHDSSSSSSKSDLDDGNDAAASLEAAEAVAVAATACTLGEYHTLTTGGDSVVIIDDINLHKSLWDITTRELVKVYGVNSVVKADLEGGSSSEMRGYFSSLIQRAARFKTNKGGGSVTLILLSTLPNEDEEGEESSGSSSGGDESEQQQTTFEASDFDGMSDKIKMRIDMLLKANVPLTSSNLRKINLPVPKPSEAENAKRLALQHIDDLISMSDGQVWFDEALAGQQGRSPPLDPSRSMTRVGIGADTRTCRADAPALRSVVGSLRFDFQQAMDVIVPSSSSTALSSTASGGDADKQVLRRDAFLLAMHQRPNEGRKLSQECIALLAASKGYLDGVLARGMPGTMEGTDAMEGLLAHVEERAREIVKSIDTTHERDLSLDERNILEEAIKEYFE